MQRAPNGAALKPSTIESSAAGNGTKTLGVSVRTVYWAFAAIDATPAQCIRHERVESAAVRLRSSGVPITDLAISLGFGDVTTFVRCFKRLHGVTPSAWRKMAR